MLYSTLKTKKKVYLWHEGEQEQEPFIERQEEDIELEKV